MSFFSFLTPKKGILETGLFQGMTDIHSHILPGVDDGVETLEEAITTLLALEKMGIKNMYLTPHVMDIIPENHKEVFEKTFKQLLEKAPKGIHLKLASEYMLDANFNRHLENGLLTFADKQVLVETSYAAPPINLENLMYEITLEGYTPVLAHPERYNYMTDTDYDKLKKRGCLFQMNLLSMIGYYGGKAAMRASELIKKDYYSFIGTDIHHLEKFSKGLGLIRLSKKDEAYIRKLIDNNNQLW